MKDREVIERIRSRDESALDYLYTKYYKMMARMILSNNGTTEEAQDIYQDALIVFWQKVMDKDFTLTAKISTYLYSICQNLWLKELERKKKWVYEEKDGETWEDYELDEKSRIIHECINALGSSCKQVLSLYYFDGMSMDEIADKLGFASSDTAKTKKYKCKKKLDELVRSKYSAGDFLD